MAEENQIGPSSGWSRRDIMKVTGAVLGASALSVMGGEKPLFAAPAAPGLHHNGVTKVLLDTDIGSDIDDAIALTYLLSQPQCELLGVTTVTGKPVVRAMIADAICRNAGRKIPIFPGLEKPILVPQRQPDVPQAAALGKWPHRTEFPLNQAIEFMQRTIRQNPHEVVLLGIGAQTNIATLFTMDPEVPTLLKGLVTMGGNFTPVRWAPAGPLPVEWNIGNDPQAAEIVYKADVPVHHSVGLDVTIKCKMVASEVHKHFDNHLWHPVLDFAAIFFQNVRDYITFHDPLATTTIFNSHICQFENGWVDVELVSERLRGFTMWSPEQNLSRQKVAMAVSPELFFKTLFAHSG